MRRTRARRHTSSTRPDLSRRHGAAASRLRSRRAQLRRWCSTSQLTGTQLARRRRPARSLVGQPGSQRRSEPSDSGQLGCPRRARRAARRPRPARHGAARPRPARARSSMRTLTRPSDRSRCTTRSSSAGLPASSLHGRGGDVVDAGLDLPVQPHLRHSPVHAHRPRQVGGHLVERCRRTLVRAARPDTRHGRSPVAIEQIIEPHPGPVQGLLGRPAYLGVGVQGPRAADTSARKRANRSVVACESSVTKRLRSTSRAFARRCREACSSSAR